MELRWDGVRSARRRDGDAEAPGRDVRRRRSGCAWSAASPSISSPRSACRPSTSSTQLAPDTPVFILHLYDRALLNGAALRAVGYTQGHADPPGGEIVRDARGNPTGLLLAKPNAAILYATLAKGPKLPFEYQLNSTRHFMRELNRLGRHRRDRRRRRLPELSRGLRGHREARTPTASSPSASPTTCSPRSPKARRTTSCSWTRTSQPQAGRRLFPPQRRRRDAGVLGRRLRGLPRAAPGHAAARWRTSSRRSCAFSRRTAGRGGCTRPTTRRSAARSTCSSASTATSRSPACTGSSTMPRRSPTGIDRSHRGARRRHRRAAPHGLPGRVLRRALRRRRRRGDAAGARGCWRRASGSRREPMRRASRRTILGSRSPGWSPAGRSAACGSIPLRNCLDRETALRMWTENVTWFSNEEGKKGRIKVGQLADLIVPDRDYFSCAEDEIADTTSDLTMSAARSCTRQALSPRSMRTGRRRHARLVAGTPLRRLRRLGRSRRPARRAAPITPSNAAVPASAASMATIMPVLVGAAADRGSRSLSRGALGCRSLGRVKDGLRHDIRRLQALRDVR